MKSLYFKLRNNLGLSMILLIGLGVEFSNFQSMFYRFMLQYRPDWGPINHIPAMFLSAFLLLCIVIFGIRRQSALSWFLALLTCVISFAVYSRMNLTWSWQHMNEIHFVILILSGMLPMLVAYTSHQIANDNDTDEYGASEREEIERLLRELRKVQSRSAQGATSARREDEKKKHSSTMTATAEAEGGLDKGTAKGFAGRFTKEFTKAFVEDLAKATNGASAEATVTAPKAEPVLLPEKLERNGDLSGFAITCGNCGHEAYKKNKRAKYCCEDCRVEAGRAKKKKKATTYMVKDEFESTSMMEWANAELAQI